MSNSESGDRIQSAPPVTPFREIVPSGNPSRAAHVTRTTAEQEAIATFIAQAEIQAGLCWYTVDLKSGLCEASSSLSTILGIASKQVHQSFLLGIDASSRQAMNESLAKLMTGGGDDEFTHGFVKADQTRLSLRTRRRVTCGIDGIPEALLCTIQVVTRQTSAQTDDADTRGNERLTSSESRYRTLFDFATDTFMLHAKGGVIVDVNHRACESFGYAKEEFIGKTPDFFSAVMNPERLEWILSELEKGKSLHYDTVHRRKDGSVFPAEVQVRPIILDGKRYAVTLSRDITERKQAELALRESEQRYRLALDTAEIGTWSYQAHSGLIKLDDRTKQHWGLDSADFKLEEMYKVLHPDDKEIIVQAYGRALSSTSLDDRVDFEHRIILPDNSVRWLSVRSLVIYSGTGQQRKFESVIGTTIDITEQRNAALALEGQSRVSELIASGQPLNLVLNEIVRFIEQLIPDSVCGILLVEDDRKHLVFAAGERYPDLIKAIRVPIGENIGACGHAAWSRSLKVVSDVTTDPTCVDYRELMRTLDKRSCWSAPILESSHDQDGGSSQRVLGTFAVYRPLTGSPDEHLKALMQTAGRLAGIALSSHQVLQDLREGEARYGIVSEMSRIVTFGLSHKPGEKWQFVWSRPQVGMLTGFSRDELMRIGWEGLVHPEDHARAEQLLREIMVRQTSKAELRLVTKSGQILYSQIHARLLSLDPTTGAAMMIGGLLDITEFKAVETALRKSEERFQLALAGSNDGLWDWNMLTNELFYSPRWKTMLGYEPDEFGANYETWAALLHPEDAEPAQQKLREFLASGANNYEIEFRMRHSDGSYRIIQSKGTLSRDASGKPVRMVGTHRDLTERAIAEQALRRSEEFLRRAQVMAHVGNWTLDMETQIFECSEEAARIFELEGLTCTLGEWLSLVHHDDLPRLRQAYAAMLAGAPFELEYRLVIRNRMKWVSSKATLEVNGAFPTPHVVGVTQDISSRTKLEEQLRQSQKMDAFGQLAGGVAHDFNNLLTVINGFSELLLAEISPSEPRREYVEQIQQAGDRAASLTRQLLTLGRRQFTEPRIIDLNEIVARSETMLKRLIGENIFVHTVLQLELPNIKADPGQIDQVILNLVVNARDAMPNGGHLSIQTRRQVIDRIADDLANTGLKEGEYVEFTVSDTGVGMSEEVKARIFEPFFSTKGVGKGTGLGLSTVYGIVKQNQAAIAVETVEGLGTTFRIWFPVANEVAPEVENLPPVALVPRGNETILVAEDEDIVRHIVVTTLQSQGYKVLAANSGEAALELASQHVGPLPLLITDMVMPGITGTELAQRLKVRHKDLRVLYMSGYTDDKFVRYGMFTAPDDFIQKPFTPTMLNRIVQELLKASRG